MSMISAFTRFYPLFHAFTTIGKTAKSISKELNYIEKTTAFTKNEKMNVPENEDVLLKNDSTSQNIGGSHLAENGKSAVNKDKNMSTDDENRFTEEWLKRVKAGENGKSGQPVTKDKKSTKKLDKEQNTVDMLDEQDPEDYGDAEGVFVTGDNRY
jgi:hypothetical protein